MTVIEILLDLMPIWIRESSVFKCQQENLQFDSLHGNIIVCPVEYSNFNLIIICIDDAERILNVMQYWGVPMSSTPYELYDYILFHDSSCLKKIHESSNQRDLPILTYFVNIIQAVGISESEESSSKNTTINIINYAISCNDIHLMEFMLDYKLINLSDIPLMTSLNFTMLASKLELKNILEILHNHNCPWSAGSLRWAIINNHCDCIEYLVSNGCPWRRATQEEIDNYIYAFNDGDDSDDEYDYETTDSNEIFFTILHTTDIDVDIKDLDGCTALIYKCRSGKKESVEFLLSMGADHNTKDMDGGTALHQAAYIGHSDVANILIKAGANLNFPDDNGKTPLHWACSGSHLSVAQTLIKYGANLNVQDITGKTALHYAAVVNDTKMLKLLMENGADAAVGDKFDQIPLLYASEQESIHVLMNQHTIDRWGRL